MLFLAFSAAILLLVFENSDLDLLLARPFYDSALGDFPFRPNGLFSPIFYYRVKFAVVAGGILAAAACLAGLSGRLLWLPPRNATLALLGLVLIPAAVAALKLVTNRHCPWNVTEFGGLAPYMSLLAQMPREIARGACFPAAHAATGFMWMACARSAHQLATPGAPCHPRRASARRVHGPDPPGPGRALHLTHPVVGVAGLGDQPGPGCRVGDRVPISGSPARARKPRQPRRLSGLRVPPRCPCPWPAWPVRAFPEKPCRRWLRAPN